MKYQNLEYQQELQKNIDLLGSTNDFLTLVEELRATKPHPLMASPTRFDGSCGFIKWDKIIFKDKLILLSQMYNKKDSSLLPNPETKDYKKYLNLLKTLSPITFHIKPKQRIVSDGFECKIFDYKDDVPTNINFMFDILFFSKMDVIKQIIKFS